MSLHKLLIISYLFPPAGGIAVQRALSLARYLPDCGFEVHVLKATTTGPVADPDLVRRIPSSVQVHEAFAPDIPFALRQKLWNRIAGSRPSKQASGVAAKPGGFSVKRMITNLVKRILSPEPEILWVPFAVRKARKIIRRHGIESVLISVPPFSALAVGTALKREMASINLISDFRDEWLGFYLKDFEFQNSRHTRRKAEIIERASVTHSDLVVAVNDSSRDVIRARYVDQPGAKFVTIANGYDPDAFTGFQSRPSGVACMLVTHAGTVYKTATPSFYLDALDRLPEAVRKNIETRFIGRVSEEEKAALESRTSPVRALGFVPQADAVKYMEETDYLLLTMINDISIPGKLYEYMATGKPILVITPRGSEVDKLIEETQCGLTARPEDPASITAMLERAYGAWRNREPVTQPRREVIDQYDRRRLAEAYGKAILEADSNKSGRFEK